VGPQLEVDIQVYRFDDFQVDTQRRELRRDDQLLPVEPQVFDLLCLLIENRDRVMSRDEISAVVWAGKVVSDGAISSRIKTLRQALGDDGRAQRYIRTAHGTGFRFVGTLVGADDGPEVPAAVDSATDRPVVAVMPFANQSGDPGQDYFSDAVSQDIITLLARHRWLSVLARNSTFGYRGQSPDLKVLAGELGADYVIDGAVRRAGDRIRITAALSDAASGEQLWSERYDRQLDDIFELQDEITARIVGCLEPEIGLAERSKVTRANRTNLQAWDYYHLGIAHFFRFTAGDNLRAQELLARSRELDPEFGEAHAWWAYAVVLGMVYWDTEPTPATLDSALEATRRALSIDDRNAIFYALKARVQLARCEYDAAVSENQMAIALNPTLAAAHCGLADSLAYVGKYDEAVACFEHAIELSPNDPQRWAFLTYGALALIFRGDYDDAMQWTRRASEIPNCQYWTWAHQAVAAALLDRGEDAASAVAQLLEACPGFTVSFAREKLFYLNREDQRQLYLDGLVRAGVPAG
jgi:TolB-like protein